MPHTAPLPLALALVSFAASQILLPDPFSSMPPAPFILFPAKNATNFPLPLPRTFDPPLALPAQVTADPTCALGYQCPDCVRLTTEQFATIRDGPCSPNAPSHEAFLCGVDSHVLVPRSVLDDVQQSLCASLCDPDSA